MTATDELRRLLDERGVSNETISEDVSFLCGDCAKLLLEMDASSVDMVLTSPPYDDMRHYGGFSLDFDAVINGIFHVLKKGGVCVWVAGDQMIRGSESGTCFRTALSFMEHGFKLHDTMIYRKRNPMPNIRNDMVRYHQSFEYMFCFTKGRPTKFNPIKIPCLRCGETRGYSFRNHGKDDLEHREPSAISEERVADNVFTYSVGSFLTTQYAPAFKHPAVFPEKLARDQIASWTNAGDVVLDPMCGSGTTLFCAYALGRKAIGIDLSEDYIELAMQRISEEALPEWATRDEVAQ